MSLPYIPKTRWGASLAHLLLSILIIGSIATFAFVQWFPAGLHLAAKLDRLLGIMLGVDIVAGPLLTLIVYRSGKDGLKFDLAVIAALQLGFLCYGLSTMWRSRPLFLVGSQQSFALIFANEVADDAVSRVKGKRWSRFHGSGPWLVAVDLSSDVAKDEFLFSYIVGDAGPLRDPDLFIPYANLRNQIIESARPLAADVPVNAVDPASVRTMALMSTRSRTTVMLLDAGTGEPLRAVRTKSAKLPVSVN